MILNVISGDNWFLLAISINEFFHIEYCVESEQKEDRFFFYIFNWEWHKIQLEMAYLDMHTNQQKKILAKINLRSKKQQTRSNKKKTHFFIMEIENGK